MTLLVAEELAVQVPGGRAVDGVSFALAPGEVLGLIGESGAGKSLTGAAIIGLLPSGARIVGGHVRLGGVAIEALGEAAWRGLRGRRVSAVFQDPSAALDPLRRIGAQLAETVRAHHRLPAAALRARVGEWLDAVGLPRDRARAYPHELSGGMRQRAALALALCPGPDLLVADEPTTALDAPLRAQVAALLRRLAARHGTAVLLISHDVPTVAAAADRVAVMYAGRIVEQGPTAAVLRASAHPYTQALMAAMPGHAPPGVPLRAIPGLMPLPGARPSGCAFHPRCPRAAPACERDRPEIGPSRAACFFAPVAADG